MRFDGSWDAPPLTQALPKKSGLLKMTNESSKIKSAATKGAKYISVIFGEYSEALVKAGRQGDAGKVAIRAQQFRKDYPERKAVAERTPYKENRGKK